MTELTQQTINHSRLLQKFRFSWAGKDNYHTLLTNAFKYYITTDCYAQRSKEEREECVMYMEQIGEIIEDIDNELSMKKNNTT